MFSLPIRTQLSIVITVAMLTIAVVILILAQNLYQQRDRDFRQAYLVGQQNLWAAIMENERKEMSTNFKVFTRDRKLKSALFKNKYDGIRELIGPTATRLRALNVASNMIVVNKEGQVVFSDDDQVKSAPAAALRAIATSKSASDIELSGNG